MSSKFCVRKSAALPENLKRSVLANEVQRRLLNTRESSNQETTRLSTLTLFYTKLLRSGYEEDEAREIIAAGCVGYERRLSRSKARGAPLHREGASGVTNR